MVKIKIKFWGLWTMTVMSSGRWKNEDTVTRQSWQWPIFFSTAIIVIIFTTIIFFTGDLVAEWQEKKEKEGKNPFGFTKSSSPTMSIMFLTTWQFNFFSLSLLLTTFRLHVYSFSFFVPFCLNFGRFISLSFLLCFIRLPDANRFSIYSTRCAGTKSIEYTLLYNHLLAIYTNCFFFDRVSMLHHFNNVAVITASLRDS